MGHEHRLLEEGARRYKCSLCKMTFVNEKIGMDFLEELKSKDDVINSKLEEIRKLKESNKMLTSCQRLLKIRVNDVLRDNDILVVE